MQLSCGERAFCSLPCSGVSMTKTSKRQTGLNFLKPLGGCCCHFSVHAAHQSNEPNVALSTTWSVAHVVPARLHVWNAAGKAQSR